MTSCFDFLDLPLFLLEDVRFCDEREERSLEEPELEERPEDDLRSVTSSSGSENQPETDFLVLLRSDDEERCDEALLLLLCCD